MITPREKHVREIDIPMWEHGHGDWFTIRLLNLMAHADEHNLYLLAQVFPDEAKAYQWWMNGKPDES